MPDHLASCSCGKPTVRVRGEPDRVPICHCLACQKRSGSAFGAQARFATQTVTTEGQSKQYLRIGDEGSSARFHFCPECGSTVFCFLNDVPDVVAVPVGAFADPSFPPPSVSGYEERKHRWAGPSDGIEHFDRAARRAVLVAPNGSFKPKPLRGSTYFRRQVQWTASRDG
ncbi:GFA family protein [Lysobacter sp. CA196]|uniref:GFA family protein n=1 Tax=Lysobacter sp. CA196 TaxID=3455606 RepID=UPI003F8D270E